MLDAAEELIHERGFDALTVGELVQRSRTSVGSFYARFEDKEALLRAVQDRVLTRVDLAFDERGRNPAATASLVEAVHLEVEAFARQVSRDAPLVRAFWAHGVDPVLSQRAWRTSRRHFGVFRAAMLKHADEIRHPDVEKAIGMAFSVFTVMLMTISVNLAPTDAPVSSAKTTSELSRVVLGYFLLDEPRTTRRKAPPKPRARGAART
jgi:AcrR family transcriptional regulator